MKTMLAFTIFFSLNLASAMDFRSKITRIEKVDSKHGEYLVKFEKGQEAYVNDGELLVKLRKFQTDDLMAEIDLDQKHKKVIERVESPTTRCTDTRSSHSKACGSFNLFAPL